MVQDTKKLKVFEMFAGYGGASFGLKKAAISHEIVGFSEIDKFAIQCYQQNHQGKNYGDATKINEKELPDFDLLTGGFPCQAFSIAGKGLGELDTRGTLFNEIIRIAAAKQPKYMLLENVKGLMSKKHESTFNKILSELKRIGYVVYHQVLNTKDFGIPQNRERVFIVCIRKDIFEYENFFHYPNKEELNIFLKDILEDQVEDKYYLSEKCIAKLSKTGFRGLKEEIASTITTENYKLGRGTNCIRQLNKPKHSNNRVYAADGISPTLRDMSAGGNRQPFIISSTQKHNSIHNTGIMNCLPSAMGLGGGHIPMVENMDLHKIRKLTPKECFRLQGFLKDEINVEGISNSQQYKLVGNGWDINLVSKIFERMFSNK